MADHVSIYVTCPDAGTARRIARDVIERRLVACANVWPISSTYRWQGAIEEAEEVAMLLKTRAERAEEAIRAIRETHPYEVPCIVALPWRAAHAPYASWVDEETT